MISGSVKSREADQAIVAVFEELKALREGTVTPEEMKHIQRSVRYGMAKALQTNGEHVGAIEEVIDHSRTPEDHLMGMNAVTSEQVREVARKYLPESREDGRYVLLLRDPLKN